MYDVVVVGAGVTGSYVAHRLASLGYEVAVFEEHKKIGEPVQCTGIISTECFRRFPLFEGTVLREANSARLFSSSGRELRLWRDSAQAYIVDRAAFDRALAEKAQQQGAHYLSGVRVGDIAILDDRVRVESEGRRGIFDAKTAVIASGFGSNLPRKLGLGRVGDLVVGAQARVGTNGSGEVEVYFDQEVAPGFFAWFIPTTEDRALVGLFSRRTPGLYLKKLLSSLFLQGKITTPEAVVTYGGVPLRPLLRTFRERVLVVGDAAGQVKPTSGGGIYYGLLCAEIAADTLHRALASNSFSERLFADYQKSWKKRIGRELWLGYRARRLYERLSNNRIDQMFDIIASRGILESLVKSPDISFDWHGDIIVSGLKQLAPWHHLFGWHKDVLGRKD